VLVAASLGYLRTRAARIRKIVATFYISQVLQLSLTFGYYVFHAPNTSL